MLTVNLPVLEQTLELGRLLGRLAQPGQILLLEGDLGAGKTTLAQAIGHGLEVETSRYITSPTFGIIHEYSGRMPLYHMDFYRIHHEAELKDLGMEEYLYGTGLTVIEWPDRLGRLQPDNYLHLHIENTGATSRRVVISAHGSGWQPILDAIADCFS
jgi:tRNA threonylcarbamoyladenosine biosynthesis protein TsaE